MLDVLGQKVVALFPSDQVREALGSDAGSAEYANNRSDKRSNEPQTPAF
jgi:hypothetical protein